MQKKFSIKNRKGFIIRGIIDYKGKIPGDVIILCHGLFGFVEKPVIKETSKNLVNAGYTVVRFDATNCVGKSQGKFEDFTVGGYVQDTKNIISDVLKKLRKKEYSIIGFSIGAMPAYIIGATDGRMKNMILQGPTYDLKYEMEVQDNFSHLKEKGWAYKYSSGLNKYIKVGLSLYQEGIKYNVDKYIKKIKCPVLVIYGSKEKKESKKTFIKLYNNINSKKKRIIISGAPHTLKLKNDINPFTQSVVKWLTDNK